MTCRVRACPKDHVADGLFCPRHQNDSWANRLERLPDGFYVVVPEWVRRAQAHARPAKAWDRAA